MMLLLLLLIFSQVQQPQRFGVVVCVVQHLSPVLRLQQQLIEGEGRFLARHF